MKGIFTASTSEHRIRYKMGGHRRLLTRRAYRQCRPGLRVEVRRLIHPDILVEIEAEAIIAA